MKADETRIPDVPHHNELFEDDMGLVWRWDDQEGNWIHEFYDFEYMEVETLRKIIRLYKDYIQKVPEEELEIQDKSYDKDQLLSAVEYLLKKFNNNER